MSLASEGWGKRNGEQGKKIKNRREIYQYCVIDPLASAHVIVILLSMLRQADTEHDRSVSVRPLDAPLHPPPSLPQPLLVTPLSHESANVILIRAG